MTIAQVSKQYDISTDTLRYYERVGLIPPVPRNASGIREYGEEDCRWVEFAKCMRSAGLPIEALIRYVQLFRQGDDTRTERRALLVEQRDRLQAQMEQMQTVLERLNYKICNYDNWEKQYP